MSRALAQRTRQAGRIRLQGEIIAELRYSSGGASGRTLRVRSGAGEEALWCGPDLPTQQVGAELDADGFWDADHRGQVFRVESLRAVSRPREMRAAEKYLVANIPGLGPKRAARLVLVLGSRALDQLIEAPEIARRIFPGGTGEAVTLALRNGRRSRRWTLPPGFSRHA